MRTDEEKIKEAMGYINEIEVLTKYLKNAVQRLSSCGISTYIIPGTDETMDMLDNLKIRKE